MNVDSVKTIDINHFESQIKEAQEVFASIHGKLASLQVNVSDPQSIRRAFTTMECSIDGKIALYRHNPIVRGMAEELKKQYRAEIFRLAVERAG